MKRLSRTWSGRQIYGPKWQILRRNDETADRPPSVESTSTADQVSGQENAYQTIKGSRADAEAMHKAALEGDWLAAELILFRDPSLAHDYITEEGDRALHVAVAMMHEEFVGNLVENMEEDKVALLDGRGYTACCYAAISGTVEIAEIILEKNPSLCTARDIGGATPLHKAILHNNEEMSSRLLKCSKIEDLSKEEWFDLLLRAIDNRMYCVGLELFERDGSLATMRNEEGTALHHLARHEAGVNLSSFKIVMMNTFSINDAESLTGGKLEKPPTNRDQSSLVKNLWTEIQKLDEPKILELIENPPILHEATKVGNMELIRMILATFPDLMWETDTNGHTMFHTAVIYRQKYVFKLIHGTGAAKHFVAVSQDENGDNILHLAARLPHPNARKLAAETTIEMQREIMWFVDVEATVPPPCLEMRNKDGQTPGEVFSKEHRSLLERSETWMRNTAHTSMLIATLLLTLVFAAAFQVPGGSDQMTGIPVHLESRWFTCFVIFEATTVYFCTSAITLSWSIITSGFEQDKFMMELPYLLESVHMYLSASLLSSVSAFLSAYFLVFTGVRVKLIESVIISVYVALVYAVVELFEKKWPQINYLP